MCLPVAQHNQQGWWHDKLLLFSQDDLVLVMDANLKTQGFSWCCAPCGQVSKCPDPTPYNAAKVNGFLFCTACGQVLDIRGSQVTRIAADALLTALSQQPALKKVLYSIRVHQMVRVHPDVEWVVDPRWTPNSRIPVGDWWGVSDEQEGERSFLFSNSSEDTDSDSTTTSSSSSESSSGRESSDVVSVSSSDGGREHDVGGAFSEDESTERSEEDSEEDSESESDMDSDTESESSTEEL